ncbi:MAG: flavodoxin family protein [Eubacteriales bacterium]|nr:flavodoxin family protein [Eubacteriales bacterium]
MSDILVLTGSPRKNGNTRMLADAFVDGAAEGGLDVRVIHVAGLNIAPCQGCGYCQEHEGVCIQKDDMARIMPHLYSARTIVFATPVYYFAMSAQLKTALDRMYATLAKPPTIDSCILLAVYGDTDTTVPEALIHNYKVFTGYSGWKDLGIVTAAGVNDAGEIAGHPALEEARELGKSLISFFRKS